MKKFYQLTALIGIAVLLAVHSFGQAAAVPQASATSFHFVFTADSRDDYSVLPALSHKMVTLNPVFGFFAGDLCGSFDVNCINNQWKPALDGNNSDGMLAKMFVSRGNHDNGTLSTWQGLWDFGSMGIRVGATNFTALSDDATYSFDYGNSHFAVIDLPGGGSNTWSSAEISWLDTDLTAAEGRSVIHEFIFAHGPMYGVTSEHGSEQPSAALKAVLNKHPISAGFHGHEHVTAYTHVTPSVETGINDYQEFILGRAGAPPYTVVKPADWHADQNAFADVAVNGNQFTVTVYSQSGSALFSKTFTDGSPSPTSTPNATSTPTTPPTALPTSTPTIAPTIGATSTPTTPPTDPPTTTPTAAPTIGATSTPTTAPTDVPTSTPTTAPTIGPTSTPTTPPTALPTSTPGGTVVKVIYRSNPTYDGQVLESSENSSAGGTVNATGTTFKVGDDASNRQLRAILSFNTAGLPDNAVIRSVTLKIMKAGSTGANPYNTLGNIMVDVRTSPFSNNVALQNGDFQATASKNSVLSIANNPVNGWYSKALSSAYFGYISKTGVTQFRLRFSTDDNNNHVANNIKFYSGDYTAIAGYRPRLVITYSIP